MTSQEHVLTSRHLSRGRGTFGVSSRVMKLLTCNLSPSNIVPHAKYTANAYADLMGRQVKHPDDDHMNAEGASAGLGLELREGLLTWVVKLSIDGEKHIDASASPFKTNSGSLQDELPNQCSAQNSMQNCTRDATQKEYCRPNHYG